MIAHSELGRSTRPQYHIVGTFHKMKEYTKCWTNSLLWAASGRSQGRANGWYHPQLSIVRGKRKEILVEEDAAQHRRRVLQGTINPMERASLPDAVSNLASSCSYQSTFPNRYRHKLSPSHLMGGKIVHKDAMLKVGDVKMKAIDECPHGVKCKWNCVKHCKLSAN